MRGPPCVIAGWASPLALRSGPAPKHLSARATSALSRHPAPTGLENLSARLDDLLVSVLLAEDDSDIRDVLAEVLRGEGYDVLEAANGLEALKLAVQTPPDIVVTDLMMPMMDGRALIRELKSRAWLSSVPIVVITAYRSRAEGLAADRTLPKPFDLDDFTATIRELSLASGGAGATTH